MAESILQGLYGRASLLLKDALKKNKQELLTVEEDEQCSLVQDYIGTAIDDVLDDNRDDFALVALLCCMEDRDLFTRDSQAANCGQETGTKSAQHCVYHNLYDALHTALELQFDEWVQNTESKSLCATLVDGYIFPIAPKDMDTPPEFGAAVMCEHERVDGLETSALPCVKIFRLDFSDEDAQHIAHCYAGKLEHLCAWDNDNGTWTAYTDLLLNTLGVNVAL